MKSISSKYNPKVLGIIASLYLIIFSVSGVYVGQNVLQKKDLDKIQKEVSAQVKSETEITNAPPQKLVFPSISHEVNIRQGGIQENEWILSDDTSFYIDLVGPVKGEHRIMIYGHNTSHILLPTNKLSEDDHIIIQYEGDQISQYEIIDTKYILGTDLSIFDYEGDAEVILLTCNGLLSEKRKVIFLNEIN